MSALSVAAMLFQDEAILARDVHSLMIAQWIMAICFLAVIFGLLVVAFVVLGVVRKAQKTVETVQGKAMPLIGQGQEILLKVQEIVAELQPKIASISSDVTHISGVVKSKVDEAGQTFSKVNATVQDVNGKTKAQAERVNGMVSEALTTTHHVSQQIQHGIKVPVQKISEWVATAKLGIEHLAERIPFLNHEPPQRRASTAGSARPTGTAAPGGPPFVPAPSRSER